MNFWNKFLSEDNFKLAWRRINTGQNVYYKRFFREVYLAYEVALEANIFCLVNRIKGTSYRPSPPDKVFIPKSSGLQRPITLLTVEDQVVWQAIANIIALKWQERRQLVESKVVFSNILNPDKIFFFEHWKISYKRFLRHISDIYKENKCVGHFDLAAYFDTISHDHIVKLITPRTKDSDFAILIKRVLNCWTSEKCSKTFSHGIPQGPIASSCIGELIFWDIDKIMTKEEKFIYLRYVDDIRVFAKDADSVREGIIKLEEVCRNKGLIPQSSKTKIFCAKSEEEAIGKHFSLTPEWYIEEKTDKFFEECVDNNKKEVISLSKLKLFLFRAPAVEKYLEIILHLFERMPEISDAFVNYLSRFENNDRAISFLVELLQKKRFPYQYVEGNVWLLLSFIDKERKSRNLIWRRAIRKILRPRNNFYLRYGLLMYLSPFVEDASKRVFNKYFYEDSSIIQSLILPSLAVEFSQDNYIKMVRRCLIRSNPDASLVAATRVAVDDINYKELKIEKKLKPIVRNCLVSLGIVKSKTLPIVTPFEEIMQTRYGVTIIDWKPFLSRDSSHAYRILVMSEKAFEINRSAWLCLIDSFNDILTRVLIRLDKTINMPIVDKNKKLTKYGQLLDKQRNFSKKYTIIADVFYLLHTRRCFVPEAHPYDEKTAKRTKPLLLGERNNFYGKLKQAYAEVDKVFQAIT